MRDIQGWGWWLLGEADEVGRDVGCAVLLYEARSDCLLCDGFLHAVGQTEGDECGGVFGRGVVAHWTDNISNDF